MGLAAFNRMRQLEEMKPENIAKANGGAPEVKQEAPVADVKDEKVNENKEEIVPDGATTRRRRKTNIEG